MEELIIVATIHLLAVMSPGPDFALVLKNSLSSGKTTGRYTSLGVGLGIGVHVLYSLVGIALIISQSAILFTIIKYLGAGYLIYIGVKSVTAKKKKDLDSIGDNVKKKSIHNLSALKQGFVTNVLNPKATLFFLSVFTQVIDPNTSSLLRALYGLEMIIATTLWFSVVTIIMTREPVRRVYKKAETTIDRVFGLILIILGISVGVSR